MITREYKGHTYIYVDAFGEDGAWIHSPSCHCQPERERIRREWMKIDQDQPPAEVPK